MRGARSVIRRRFAAALLALLPMGAWAADPQITSLTDTPDPATAGGLYTYAVGIDKIKTLSTILSRTCCESHSDRQR